MAPLSEEFFPRLRWCAVHLSDKVPWRILAACADMSRAFGIGSVCFFGVMLLGLAAGYRLNVTASVPRGIFRIMRLPPQLDRGLLVVLRVPPSMRPFHPRWLPLLKPIAGVADDVICRHDDMLLINGELFGPIVTTSNGQSVPVAFDSGPCLTVPQGSVFLASRVPRSLDSRYFGMVRYTDLTAVAVPVWTWRADGPVS